MATKTTPNTDAAPASEEATVTTQEERVWVRILKNGVHAEGGRFRAGARVKVAASIADKMVTDKVAVKLVNYY